MTWLTLVLGALAVYALAFTGAKLEGPFGIAKAVRKFAQDWVVNGYDKENTKNPLVFEDYRWFWLYDGVQCPFCQSFWWSWLVLVLFLLPVPFLHFLAYGLALSGASMLLFNLAGE